MTPGDSTSRREWVLAVLDSYEGRLLRYAQRLTRGDVNSARDVVQHAFLQLCRQPPGELNGRLGSWLYAVCRNRAIDLKRRSCRLEPFVCGAEAEAPGRELDPAELLETLDAGDLVRRAIGTLPERQQEVVNLWSEGFAYREISEITGATENYVRVLAHRALQTLRQHPLLQRLIAEEADATSK
ncbi:MAG TPA: sigma-70 family RNA polymerase sigma factor [Pirellulales bacterium]|nr:sigma-70 family RNA polymerase sigma factor [Pirellulales bacterium]